MSGFQKCRVNQRIVVKRNCSNYDAATRTCLGSAGPVAGNTRRVTRTRLDEQGNN
jgi:hypothetical protein